MTPVSSGKRTSSQRSSVQKTGSVKIDTQSSSGQKRQTSGSNSKRRRISGIYGPSDTSPNPIALRKAKIAYLTLLHSERPKLLT